MPLILTDCIVDKTSIKVFFSNSVDPTSAQDVANYTIFAPPAFDSPTELGGSDASATYGDTPPSVRLDLKKAQLRAGDALMLTVTNLALAGDPGTPALLDNTASIAGRVPDDSSVARITRDVEDVVAYPILTEQVGFPPAPVQGITQPMPSGGVGPDLGQVAAKAISDVLGWKANAGDAKGFVGALTQSFTLTEVDGHVESTWRPRTYAVQTDLGGGISGAQASLYSRAKDALDQCLPLLDGLYPLDPEAEPELTKALQQLARSQMTEIVNQLGTAGGPSVLRVDTYFQILLGVPSPLPPGFTPPPDADALDAKSTLGSLRDAFGIGFKDNPFSNSVEDEQDITNFRIIVDYMLSIWQSWLNNREFFTLGQNTPAFFGTQLVLISRQFSVISESVDELRFALDSVFIGPSERQTLLLNFADGTPGMFLEDILQEIQYSAGEEWPRLIRDGGRLAVNNNVVPLAESLLNLVELAHAPTNIDDLPDGYRTARVRNALDNVQDQLRSLISLAGQVGRDAPSGEGGIFVFPPILDFGAVSPGSHVTQTITIANMSSAKISGLQIKQTGDDAFTTANVKSAKSAGLQIAKGGKPFLPARLRSAGIQITKRGATASAAVFTYPSSLGPNETIAATVTFAPTQAAHQGTLTVTAGQQKKEVVLLGGLEQKAAQTEPKKKGA
jgi:hypothetical protein